MDVTVVLMAFLLQGFLKAEASVVVSGEEGMAVKIKCEHSNAFYNVKYFCKEACRDEDVLVTSETQDKNGKYRIEDKGNTFYVTVSKLTAADAGNYWCGIQRVGVDTYNNVNIRVTPRTTHEGDSGPISANTLNSKTPLYIGASLGVVLLGLAIVLLLLFRYRKRHISSSREKDDAAIYVRPSKEKPDGCRDVSEASASEMQETCSTADHVYSNVSSQPQNQPEVLYYSSVSFNKHASCGAVTPATSSPPYTSVKHSAKDELTVYSSV